MTWGTGVRVAAVSPGSDAPISIAERPVRLSCPWDHAQLGTPRRFRVSTAPGRVATRSSTSGSSGHWARHDSSVIKSVWRAVVDASVWLVGWQPPQRFDTGVRLEVVSAVRTSGKQQFG